MSALLPNFIGEPAKRHNLFQDCKIGSERFE